MYYIIINGRQEGPYRKDELIARGVTKEMPVWRSGMCEWMPAANVADLQDLFEQTEQRQDAPFMQQTFQQHPGSHFPEMPRKPPVNWLPWAVVCTILGLCSCVGLILGIIAWGKASSANRCYAAGDYFNGDRFNSTAKILTIIGLVFDGVAIFCGSFAESVFNI